MQGPVCDWPYPFTMVVDPMLFTLAIYAMGLATLAILDAPWQRLSRLSNSQWSSV
ncbi:MAG: hypothetical protein AB7E27_04020 [Candidatus Methanomethylophilaceae archaeon]